ncbi:F0F1 ATP synthase subunit B [Planctomycetota bacterium]|nr:F0F1 ATP synthase subunit B [Planctomycetota bacterium]
MLIDWFTVGAQALNFVILVWLMKRFLYGPILRVVEARDDRVAAELADAKQQQLEAQQARAEFRDKNEKLDQARETFMREAKDEADTEGQRLLAAAREAADEASTKHQQALDSAAKSLNRAIAGRAQQEVFAIAKQALADLATASLEERLTEVFVGRLRELDDTAKAELATALKSATDAPLVRSAFDLPAAQRTAIQNALDETFSVDTPVHFEAAPALVGGIELTTNGRKVAWSIAEYLRSLAEGVQDLIGTKRESDAEVAPDAQEAVTPHGA